MLVKIRVGVIRKVVLVVVLGEGVIIQEGREKIRGFGWSFELILRRKE